MSSITEKHWESGENYNRYITAELESFRKNAWKEQIENHFPSGKKLKILDAGTGPGFFSCILAEDGHDVTGVDFSDGMLKCATANAKKLGVAPSFLKMDLNAISFEDHSFDVIVTRNVTWTLQHPEKVYTEFRRVLRPGGLLLIYDANWHMHYFGEEKMKRVLEREKAYLEKYGKEGHVSGGDLEYFKTAPLTSILRPQWDEKTLSNLGFDVSIQEDIGQKVYEQWEKELYGESPLFEICAVKKEKSREENNMQIYWQKRADTFGFASQKESLASIGARYQRYFPQGVLKVLDVGAGTGTISAAIALLGYEVTAVDLCSNMIQKAKENTRSLGLNIDFMCTSAGDLPFADDTFDVIVSRNVTWVLPEPEETFRQWQRVLKPGGMLVYIDANQYYYHHNEQEKRNRELFGKINGSLHNNNGHDENYDYSLCDDTAYDLPMSKLDRPYEWDEEVLPKLGFEIVGEEIIKPQVKLKYGIAEGFSTNFLIAAINAKDQNR